MTKDQFIEETLNLLNEAGSIDGSEMVGADISDLRKNIERLYPASWRKAVNQFPRSWFTPEIMPTTNKTTNNAEGTGYIILPDNYLMLVAFKMAVWKQACKVAQEETEDIARKQANEYLRGTPNKPICVLRWISSNNTLKRALVYYSVPRRTDNSMHTVEYATYIPNVTTIPATIDDQLALPLAHICAITILNTFEKDNAAKALEQQLLKMM